MIATSPKQNCERVRKAANAVKIRGCTEGDFVLVARDELFQGENLALRWTGTRTVIKALSDFVSTQRKYSPYSCLSPTLLLRRGSRQGCYPSSRSFF